TPTPEGPVSRAAIEYHVYQRVNFHRASYGYEQVQLNESLREVARHHSEEMAEADSLAVKASSDQALDARLERFGVDCQSSTETVARVPFDTTVDTGDGNTVRYETPKEVASAAVREWMRGQGSKSKILRIEWTRVGIGVHVVEEADGAIVYVTQDLCED
ncbi:MAG: CAP domain-containing protein, partial [Halobacteriales archaeon]|nr:CAP domain-containing protein [Halobacteriales archaeon]